jgi:hypothetical protein
MIQEGKIVLNYYRKDGYIFTADHITRTVSVPQSIKEEDYPDEIKAHLKDDEYFKQLTIE